MTKFATSVSDCRSVIIMDCDFVDFYCLQKAIDSVCSEY